MEKVKSTTIEGLYQYIYKGCSKHGRYISVPLEWKYKVIDKADENIKTLYNKTSSIFHKSVLQQNKP